LTLRMRYNWDLLSDNAFPTREIVVTENTTPLQIRMPAASLVGVLDNPADTTWKQAEIEAIPSRPDLPTRTCRGELRSRRPDFRFLGLAPGEYTLRIRVAGCEEKRVPGVIVERGKTAWLGRIALQSAAKSNAPREADTTRGPAP
jgi:hypothetical protein